MIFNVDSYLEYFLTLLGWIINNGIFGLLISTGAFLLPLIGVLISTWLEVKKQGADEGNKGDLLIDWLSLKFYPAMFVIVLTLAPILPISLNNLEYNVDRSKQCGYKVALAPQDNGYSPMVSEFGNKQAKVPLLWGLIHALNKGITHGAISVIPCKRDLRQIRFEIQHEQIKNPALLTEVRQFVQQCYLPARNKVLDSQIPMNAAQSREVSWLGGKILITNSELYPRYRAKQPMQRWSYDKFRDEGLPNTGEGGFPRCDQWWADSSIGLKDMLLANISPSLSNSLLSISADPERLDEALLKTLVRPENIDVSRGKVYAGYGGNLDPTIANAANKLTSSVGVFVSKSVAYPGLDALRTALPMVQSLLIMAVILLIPIITIFSGYSLKSIVTLIFVQFALTTTTFWWELARWLDSFLIDILYDAEGHSASFSYFLENTEDDMILNFVLGTMFIVFPTVWIGSMSWAGVHLGGLANSFNQGTERVKQAGEEGGKEIKNTASNFLKK